MARLTHVDTRGAARMVDVTAKAPTRRMARASGVVTMLPALVEQIRRQALPKGDVLTVAQIAGVQAAKQTATLIPLCHPLPLTHVEVHCALVPQGVAISATVRTTARTGVEMEALTAVSVAALTLYDMCKAAVLPMEIGPIRLEEKTGGKQAWRRAAGQCAPAS